MEQKQHGFARRAAVGLVRGWSYSIGLTGAVHAVIRLVKRVLDALSFVRNRLTDGPENYRHETFPEAVARLNLSESHLVNQARVFGAYAFWSFVATMVATACLAYAPFTDHPINAIFMAVAAIAITGSQWLKWRFRYAQIRDQELYSFGLWFFSPRRW